MTIYCHVHSLKKVHNKNIVLVLALFGYKRHWCGFPIFKGAHSNICMKIYVTSKLTQYIRNIFKIRFPVINCKNIHSNAKMEFWKKMCQATMLPSVIWISLQHNVHIEIWESPNIYADEFTDFYSLDLKNRYVSANINMESSKIIVNIPQKLVC